MGGVRQLKVFPPMADLLPHSGAMILLDEVVEERPESVVCRVRLRPDSPFAERGRIAAVVALEYMAQAISAFVGLRARAAGRPVKIGWLLGTRELVLEVDSFAAGDDLLIEAKRMFGEERLASFDCTVTLRGRTVAQALVNVYQEEQEAIPR